MFPILGTVVTFLLLWLGIGTTAKTAAIICGIVFIAVAFSQPHYGGGRGMGRRY